MNLRPTMLLILGSVCVIGKLYAQASGTTVERVPCGVDDVATPSQPWYQVQGDGFTYCLPADWVPADGWPLMSARSWSFGGNRMEWAPGPARWSMFEPTGLTAVQLANSLEASRVCPLPQRVVIGGQRVEVAACGSGTRYQTLAYWGDMGMHFSGFATDPLAVQLQLTMFRTVRPDAAAKRPPSN